ncbi:hypothetical protein B0H19DRAFT_1260082 [Mycena capillaripes]|nr:hypothetical protein B0H19DRAFT_1260082 [Mycena capillaripes]
MRIVGDALLFSPPTSSLTSAISRSPAGILPVTLLALLDSPTRRLASAFRPPSLRLYPRLHTLYWPHHVSMDVLLGSTLYPQP